jgi:putative PIG3 family NAD(P)H quinone oxidoreductase
MQAIVVLAPGGPEQLSFTAQPDPSPSAHEVLIEVHATALNRADLLQRRGLYPPPAGESEILGLECAGVITAVGREVSPARLGERVMALLPGGGYAELARVHENLLLPMPEAWSFEQAAAVPEAFLTSYEALLRSANLGPGERVLIHAGASGVGSAALQIAREVGAFVFATAKGASKLQLLLELGAERAIDYELEDFAEVVTQASRGAGVDVIVDLVGATYAERNQSVLAHGGRWVVVGLLGGAKANIDLGRLLMRRQTLTGIVMRSRPLAEKTNIVRGFRRDLLPWLGEGRLVPVIDRVFDLRDAALAHEHMEANRNLGKIVLRVR